MAVGLLLSFAFHLGLNFALKRNPIAVQSHAQKISTLDENGYNAVVAKQSDAAMKEFILRVVERHGGSVKDFAALNGILRFYSGVTASQNYHNLIRELAGVVWIDWSNAKSAMKDMRNKILALRSNEWKLKFKRLAQMGRSPGGVCKLNEKGFHEVVEATNDDQMETFMKRLITTCGGAIEDVDKLHRFVPFYSGSSNGRSQSYSSLINELKKQPWISNFTNSEACSPEAKLDEEGYGRVARKGSFPSTELFIRRAIVSVNATVDDDTEFETFVYSHNGKNATGKTFSQLTRELKAASWISGYAIPLGIQDLNEEGYRRFVDLRSNGDMGRFARLLLSARGGTVVDKDAFADSVAEYSGVRESRTKSFAEMSKFLEGASFVAYGKDGPLKLPESTSSTD